MNHTSYTKWIYNLEIIIKLTCACPGRAIKQPVGLAYSSRWWYFAELITRIAGNRTFGFEKVVVGAVDPQMRRQQDNFALDPCKRSWDKMNQYFFSIRWKKLSEETVYGGIKHRQHCTQIKLTLFGITLKLIRIKKKTFLLTYIGEE